MCPSGQWRGARDVGVTRAVAGAMLSGGLDAVVALVARKENHATTLQVRLATLAVWRCPFRIGYRWLTGA